LRVGRTFSADPEQHQAVEDEFGNEWLREAEEPGKKANSQDDR
jgi:hypothetical protein